MMRHNLPKIVSVLLLICMIFSISVPYAAAAETAPEYWTFIARDTEADAWRWEEMGIDIHDYVDGYVYAQDMESKTIHLVLPKKTYSFWEVDSGVYCFTKAGEVIHVGYSGKSPTVIAAFQPDEAPTFSALFASDRMTTTGLYFADKEHVQFIDCANNKVTDCGYYPDVQSIRAVSENEFFWVDSEDMGHLFNSVTAETEEMSIDEFESAVNYGIDTTALTTNYPNNSYSLGQYGAGKYFTKNGSACTDHWPGHNPCNATGSGCNCKFYGFGIQCMGFAVYAYDQYSHRSYWQDIAGDQKTNDRKITSAADFKSIVTTLPSSGIYLRIEGKHSLFIENVSDTGITGYECNIGGKCIISKFSYTYQEIANSYNGGNVCETYSHHFSRSTATVVTPNAHKIKCISSGCTGYILEPHYETLSTQSADGSAGTCAACGYTGEISLTWEEAEPYLSQNCKD